VKFNRKHEAKKEYARWLKQIDWKVFCTFTYAWRVSDPQADKTFIEFINRLERSLKSNVGYVRGDEKRFSGCGKPASARHYHAVLTSAIPLEPTWVASLWMEMAGHRSDHAGAKVDTYNPAANGIEYVLKFISQPEGDWKFGRLELFHPEARSLHTVNARWNRRLRRIKAR
jgi:hypothetical protein